MKILLTGANGYIGKRLLPVLLQKGHDLIAVVRDRNTLQHLSEEEFKEIDVVEADFLKQDTLQQLPVDIDTAFYLIHSLSNDPEEISQMERTIAENFVCIIANST
jgi:uncharacterized protein YbjT (DUF2867 family)